MKCNLSFCLGNIVSPDKLVKIFSRASVIKEKFLAIAPSMPGTLIILIFNVTKSMRGLW